MDHEEARLPSSSKAAVAADIFGFVFSTGSITSMVGGVGGFCALGGPRFSISPVPATVGSNSPKLTSISSIFDKLGGFIVRMRI